MSAGSYQSILNKTTLDFLYQVSMNNIEFCSETYDAVAYQWGENSAQDPDRPNG